MRPPPAAAISPSPPAPPLAGAAESGPSISAVSSVRAAAARAFKPVDKSHVRTEDTQSGHWPSLTHTFKLVVISL